MLWVAVAIGVSVALMVVALAAPVVVDIDAERGETAAVRWRVTWLFGLLDARSGTRRGAATTAPESAAPQPREPATRRKRGGRVALAALRTRGFARRVARLIGTLFRRVQIERFHVAGRFGLEDPADTGFVYGCLSPLVVLAGTEGLNVHCGPMFEEAGVKGVIGATVRVRPLAVLGTIVAFLVSPPAVRAMRAAWRARR